MPMEGTKKFRMLDVMLSVICIVYMCEAAAPAAAIGNQQFFWWILLLVVFALPYGLVVCEMGTTYNDDAGLYGWIRKAFGENWAARTAWFYWINFTLWTTSLAVLFTQTLGIVIGVDLGPVISAAIELVFIWVVVAFGFTKISDSPIVMNVCAVLKVCIGVGLFVLGVYHLYNHGFTNDMSWQTFLPSADTESLSYLSVILFNFMGFEVIATYSDSMTNPQRQIPRAIVLGGIVIVTVYLLSSFGITAAVQSSAVSLDSGIMDAAIAMLGAGHTLIPVIGLVFMVTLLGNMASWSYGVNIIADYAAWDSNMPFMFSIEGEGEQPHSAAVLNGMIASIFILLIPVMSALGFEEFFWTFFGCSVVFLMFSYLPMFPALLKMRAIDPSTPRPFKVPGPKWVLALISYVPVVVIILALVATIIPLGTSAAELAKLPMLAISIVVVLIGEANVWRRKHRIKRRDAGWDGYNWWPEKWHHKPL